MEAVRPRHPGVFIARLAVIGALLAGVPAADAAPAKPRPVDGIMDNSFLVEEAYNQEAGVVQHIFNVNYAVNRQRGPDDRILALSFTQEWPVPSQRHQFSYTVPYWLTDSEGQKESGFGDLLLNYRFQAHFDEKTLRAFAPRASLVLPTGRKRPGFGEDTVGAQFNLPFSTAWGDHWFTHFNAGLTCLPDALSAGSRDLKHFNLGASVICAATPDLHLMVEWTGNWLNLPDGGAGLKHEFTHVVSPGLRRAWNFADDSQLVLGVAVPVGLNRAAPDIGVFLYLSFEHFFVPRR